MKDLQPTRTVSVNAVATSVSAKAGYRMAGAPPHPGDANGPEVGGLLEYLSIIRRRKGTLILISVFGILAGLLISLPQTPIYQAKSSLEIQDMNDSFLNMNKLNPVSESSGNTTSLTDIQTQIKILQSETLTDRVMEKLKVKPDANDGLGQERLSAWRKALNLGEPEHVGKRDKALKMASKSLKVRAAGQTRIIEILSDSTDPKLAADFANTLANEYIEQNMEARWKMTERTGVWLTRQIDDMRVKLERSEDSLQAYARQSGLLFTSDKNSVAEEKLRQMQEELSKAQADRVSRQSRYQMAKSASADSLPDVLNDTSLREYQVKLTDLKRQRSELSTVYTPTHSKVRRLDAEIETLEAALTRERTAIQRRIKNEYDEAVQRENLLSADYATQTRLVTNQSEKSIQYNILKREVDSNRQLYDAMLQKMKEASVASAMRASNVRVVDAAKPPKLPYKPNIPTNVGLGLLSGIFVGISFVIMRERANRTLQQPGDAAHYLNLVELGVIPSGTMDRSKPFAYMNRKALEESPTEPNANLRLEMVTWSRKPSAMAESFRAVLTSILFSGQNGARPQVLMMTSAGPKEGKTTVTCNLGVALAEVKGRVLLIDGDMRRPRLHEIFETPNEKGLSTLLREKSPSPEALQLVVHETKVPGLFLLPSGPATSSAANLLHSDTMQDMLDRLEKEFDTILIDTPPMLQIPDARVVGRLVDGVIMVVRAGHTTRDAALAARQRFADDKTEITGVILNDWNPKSSPNGFYGYYNGYYYKAHNYYSRNDTAAS
jgi:capsular exopolysaccharide synthesis family protein